ncbi:MULTISPECIES: hypothetical protein [Nocardiaceae]|uniref:hypothetical protein n=1 Tax=Nocardiaceae TaxID=85025 RepID=UPI000AB149FB|nr:MULTISPECIES: hypothetical protein [Rhodococcus]
MMQWRDAVQLALIVVLAGVGTCLLVVGAYGSGGVMLALAALWFWRVYRTTE